MQCDDNHTVEEQSDQGMAGSQTEPSQPVVRSTGTQELGKGRNVEDSGLGVENIGEIAPYKGLSLAYPRQCLTIFRLRREGRFR